MSYRKQLDDLVNKHQITTAGKEWFTSALDPFHDFEHVLAGYPDADGANTVVSCYQYQVDIGAPAGTVGNWDCHVFSLPIAEEGTFSCQREGANAAYHETPGYQKFSLSFLNACTSTASVLVPGYDQLPDVIYNLPGDAVREVAQGSSRVIAAGFEIINTTAELYKQGTLTAYRNPTNIGSGNVRSAVEAADGQTQVDNVYGPVCSQPPPDPASAVLLRGTRTWAASEGAYVPLSFATIQNPLGPETNTNPMFSSDDSTHPDYWIQYHQKSLTDSAFYTTTQKMVPLNVAGAFLTGLHKDTNLTVKLRVFVEKAPGFTNPELAALATPSANYDVAALELYSRVIHELPVAVDVKQNAKGDWWKGIMSTLRGIASPVATVMDFVNPGVGKMIRGFATAPPSDFAGDVKNYVPRIINAVKNKKNASTRK